MFLWTINDGIGEEVMSNIVFPPVVIQKIKI